MSKIGMKGYISLIALFVVFNVIAFAVPFSKTSVFFVAYVFALFAIAFQIYVFKVSFAGSGSAKSKFYGFPIAKIGVIYLAAQLILSLVEMGFASVLPMWLALVLNVVLTAIAVVGCIAAEAMRDEIVRQDGALKKDVDAMRTMQSMAAALIGLNSDDSTKEIVRKVAEEFKYSDPVTSEQSKELETELSNLLNEMRNAMIDGETEATNELGKKIISNLAERNRICALNK